MMRLTLNAGLMDSELDHAESAAREIAPPRQTLGLADCAARTRRSALGLILQLSFTTGRYKTLVAVHEAWAEVVMDREKGSIQACRLASHGERMMWLGLLLDTQRQLQFQIKESLSGANILDGGRIPTLGFRHFSKLLQVFGGLQLQPAHAALGVQREHAEGGAYDDVLDPALPNCQVFQFLSNRRVAQQRMLLA